MDENNIAVGAAIPQSAQVGGALPEGAQIGAPTIGGALPTDAQVHMSDEDIKRDVDSLPHHSLLGTTKNALHATYDVLSDEVVGGAKGLGNTAIDTANLVRSGLNKIGFNIPLNENHFEPTPNTAQEFGYGGETLLEFIMGDEALKGLSWADKLSKSAAIAKILGKSERAMKALKLGANVGKAMAELGPEERAALQKSPVLARLVGLGMDSIRAGAVQGGQTFIHTRNPGKAGTDALKMAGTNFAIGAPFSTLGGVLEKGRSASELIQQMTEAATTAPSEQGVAGSLGDAISGERGKIDAALEGGKSAAEEHLTNATGAAESEKDTVRNLLDQIAESRHTAGREGVSELQKGADARLQGASAGAATSLTKAHGEAHQTLLDSLASISHNAMDPKELAETVNEGINHAEGQTHKLYEESINSIIDRLEGSKVPVAESPISKRAQELLREPMPDDHAAVALAKKGSGNNLNKDVRTLLESLATGQVAKEGGKKAAKAVGEVVEAEGKPMSDWTADNLIKLRQEIRQWASGYMRGDVNARALNRLLPAIDDTLSKVADQSGDPEVVNVYSRLRGAYRQAREVLDSTTADKLNLQRPDQAMNDVSKYLLGGANPSAKIATLQRIVGDGTMQEIAKSKVQQLQRLAATDPAKFLKEWTKIPADVKQDFFGNDLVGQVDQAANTYTKSTQAATEVNRAALESAKAENTSTLATAKNVSKAHEIATKAEQQTGLQAAEGKYQKAVESAKQVYDDAVKAAKDIHAVATEPFSGGFMKQLSEGRVNEALFKGKVDVQDINNIKKAIGDAKWQDIGDGVFQRAIADSSPKGRFDPGKLMEWWNGINPDVRQQMFGFNAAKYNSAIQEVKQSAAFQRLVKAGVLGSTIAATGSGVIKLGPLAEIIAVAGGLAGHNIVRTFVDWVANHPATWKTIAGLSKVADSGLASQGGRVARYGAARSVMDGAASSLGGNQ